MIAAIVCVDQNFAIGNKGKLPIYIPEYIKYFKKITKNGTVLIGKNAYKSLFKKPLPNCNNIIITRKCKKKPKIQSNGTIHSNMKYIKAWLANEEVINENNGIYVIGGGLIYKELLNQCERVYITKVLKTFDEADTFFPNIDELPEWELTTDGEIKEYNGIKYQFCIYDRCDYEITNIQTPDNPDSPQDFDMVITIKTFNGYKTVVLQTGQKDSKEDITVYADTWDYLHTQENLMKFLDKVEEFNKKQEVQL